ncbi:MAG: futalosine hydrolase [Draconibacterium sp.]|nr:futalosine hydrolase [Draconibacterium sp.]
MKILIVAATWMEVNLLIDEFNFLKEKSHLLKQYEFVGIMIDVLITGIGVTFTTFHLTNTLKDSQYNMVLNIGIAGSFTRELNIGEIVNVVSEEFADLGIETKDEFLTLFESGFIDSSEFPFEQGILKATNNDGLFDLKKVRGITTNKSHGRFSSIAEINQKFSAHVESMEGASVFYVCNWLGVPCHQIRTISNFIEPRDSSKWNIPLALENLKVSILTVLKKLTVTVN